MKAFALALALGLVACNSATTDGPEPIKFDRDTCHKCGMIISDHLFAAEVRGGPKSALVKFDDVGCALSWLSAQPFSADPNTRVWVARLSNGALINARDAHFVGGKTSPMGYGFGALDGAEPGLDFESLRKQIPVAGTHRHGSQP